MRRPPPSRQAGTLSEVIPLQWSLIYAWTGWLWGATIDWPWPGAIGGFAMGMAIGSAARGAALISLESLSRDHPGDVNAFRPLLHELAARDPNAAVRRLAVFCLRNGAPNADTIRLLDGIAESEDADADLRKAARAVSAQLVKKSRAK